MSTVDDTLRQALREQPAVALALDLVERASQELQRQDAEIERLHHLVEALLVSEAPFAIVEGTTVRGWSSGAEVITGTSADKALGRSLATLLSAEATSADGTGRWTDREGRAWSIDGAAAGDGLRVIRLRPADEAPTADG